MHKYCMWVRLDTSNCVQCTISKLERVGEYTGVHVCMCVLLCRGAAEMTLCVSSRDRPNVS